MTTKKTITDFSGDSIEALKESLELRIRNAINKQREKGFRICDMAAHLGIRESYVCKLGKKAQRYSLGFLLEHTQIFFGDKHGIEMIIVEPSKQEPTKAPSTDFAGKGFE